MPEPSPPRALKEARRLLFGPGSELLLVPWRDLDLRRLGRVLLHSILVGLLAGAAACAFYYVLESTQRGLLGSLAGLTLAQPGHERTGLPFGGAHVYRPWLVVLLPVVGGLVTGFVVHRYASGRLRPGGTEYMSSFHHGNGRIPPRLPIVQAIASIVTMGTGGATGREGPTMHISAGIGAAIGRWLRLGTRERRILIVAGASAGFGAIFQTPLGAALYAVEVLYHDDFETDAVVPCVLASVTGYSIFTTVFGPGHLFTTAAHYPFLATALPLYGVMALGVSAVGAVYVQLGRSLRRHVFDRILVRAPFIRPAVGGLVLGVSALALPEVLGTGYGVVQQAIVGDGLTLFGQHAWWVLLAFAGVKMLATAITLSSGGAGGEFGPTLVIGGLAGGAFGIAFHGLAPSLVPDPGSFALVGMAAMLGGVGHVPLSSLIIVCEMASTYDLLVPLMLAEGVAFVALRRVSLFPEQKPSRLHSPAHRHEATIDLLDSVRVAEIVERGVMLPCVHRGDTLAGVKRALATATQPALIVLDAQDEPCGLLSIDHVRAAFGDPGLDNVVVAADVATRYRALGLEDDLHDALHAFVEAGSSVLPVVDEASKHVGIVTYADVVTAYERAADDREAMIRDATTTQP